MFDEPRHEDDYEPRQVAAAKRVIVDVMQVLASFEDCLVLVGGWVPDFLVMKSIALAKRDKPKDAYDICYCLDYFKGGIPRLAKAWRSQMAAVSDVARSMEILREKFGGVDSYGPMQVVEFHNETDVLVREEQARRAFELVTKFLTEIDRPKNDR